MNLPPIIPRKPRSIGARRCTRARDGDPVDRWFLLQHTCCCSCPWGSPASTTTGTRCSSFLGLSSSPSPLGYTSHRTFPPYHTFSSHPSTPSPSRRLLHRHRPRACLSCTACHERTWLGERAAWLGRGPIARVHLRSRAAVRGDVSLLLNGSW